MLTIKDITHCIPYTPARRISYEYQGTHIDNYSSRDEEEQLPHRHSTYVLHGEDLLQLSGSLDGSLEAFTPNRVEPKKYLE
jgi:hypothetical protein